MNALIVTADDFGLCRETTEAVCLLHDRGIVRRTSLIVNTDGFEDAVAALRARPALEAAIHLNLTDGAPLCGLNAVRSLVDSSGRFPGGRHYVVALRICSGAIRPADVYSEWSAQIERAKEAGVNIVQLTAHGHLHVMPPLRPVVVRLLEQFAIPSVRVLFGYSPRGLALGPCSALLARAVRERGLPVGFGSRIVGLGWQGALTAARLSCAMRRARDEPTELLVHPAVGPNTFHRRWGYDGRLELSVLLRATPELSALRPVLDRGDVPS